MEIQYVNFLRGVPHGFLYLSISQNVNLHFFTFFMLLFEEGKERENDSTTKKCDSSDNRRQFMQNEKLTFCDVVVLENTVETQKICIFANFKLIKFS